MQHFKMSAYMKQYYNISVLKLYKWITSWRIFLKTVTKETLVSYRNFIKEADSCHCKPKGFSKRVLS